MFTSATARQSLVSAAAALFFATVAVVAAVPVTPIA